MIFIVNKIPAIPGQCVQWHRRVYVVILMDIEWKCGDGSVATGQTHHGPLLSLSGLALCLQTAFSRDPRCLRENEFLFHNNKYYSVIVQQIHEMTDICILCRPVVSAGHLLLGPDTKFWFLWNEKYPTWNLRL